MRPRTLHMTHLPYDQQFFSPLKAELNPTCHVLALLGAHHIFHVSGLRVNKDRDLDLSLIKNKVHVYRT